MTEQELIEALADKEHASWARWMHYLFSKCMILPDASVIIPADLVTRWKQQTYKAYEKLSEQEKQSDRDEVAHILPLIKEYRQTLLEKIRVRAQAAYLTSPHYPSVLAHALEDISELCQEQLKENNHE